MRDNGSAGKCIGEAPGFRIRSSALRHNYCHTPRMRGIQYAAASRFHHNCSWNTGSSAGACHRAARRADPVADDDSRDSIFKQQRCSPTQLRDLAAHPREFYPERSAPKISEGAGNAGRSMRPQPRVQNKKHTSIVTTVTPETPGIPYAMVHGLFRALPGDRAFLSPSFAELPPPT